MTELQSTQVSETVPGCMSNNTCSFPQIIDALLMTRLQMYINAALGESNQTDNIAHVLALERALKVVGKSHKPPSIRSSVVSFLLCASLTRNIQTAFIKIRNDLSKCRSNSIYGRQQIGKQDSFFNDLKKELKTIQEVF